MNTIHTWHQLLNNRDVKNIHTILAEEVVLHSPVVHTPVVGKKIVTVYLMAAFQTLANEHFKYVREVAGENTAVLEFVTEIDGIYINGVDMITWNDAGLITDFKVMLRPLKAVNLVHQMMGAMLEKMPKY